MAELSFQTIKENLKIRVGREQGQWLARIFEKTSIDQPKNLTLRQVKEDYEKEGLQDFELFWDNKPVNTLYKAGLLIL
jgi:hypothetical protein